MTSEQRYLPGLVTKIVVVLRTTHLVMDVVFVVSPLLSSSLLDGATEWILPWRDGAMNQ